MPAPSSSLSTLRPEIADSMEEYNLAMDRAGFVWNRVFPVFEVDKSSGQFGAIPVEQLLQNRETVRAPGGGYNRGNWTFEQKSFATEEHGAEEPIDDREAALYRDYFDAEAVSAERARDAVLRNAEKRVAAAVFNATTFASQKTAVTNEWDDLTNATPITDVENAVRAVWNQCGLWPNTLVINRHVFRNLRRCSQILDRIESGGAGFPARAGDVTVQQLAEVFDLDNIVVAGGTKNAAAEGQSVSFDKIWSDEYAMVCRTVTGNDIREPGLGRTFHWGEDGSSVNGTVETYRDETVRSDVVRVRHDVDELMLYTECGHLLENITT